ncbi:hypothetical protein I6I10_06890 [Corynebacterium glucuronolyticum]|uniref:Uncharacterized protein n=1 Tax=Corynebacterium glucuronolyticum TaxID=39791 RepID=A0A7T4EDF4_9CORY|nr:hypothetical protein [Corynebacterium glucuronolyticum]QQB45336.1 hypothetical protein I6I10_07260 [Corynebacterium glucuronolyticum]QQB47588.1 hypothetical protein I6I10_06890 [Corynebacterium glucuronolyticum]WKD64049.1 hypothetical protein CGLUCO_09020 [Corynebacterium glucuronolyticum DSM 44120]SMB82291.1 hypothetical protein SAMN05660745_02614 [Corynebacterium glucuronolyticum]
MPVNAEITDEAKGIKQELDNIVGFLKYAAHDLETGIPGAVYPGEDLHPHMWERLSRLTYHLRSIAIDCSTLSMSLDRYTYHIGVEFLPDDWRVVIMDDLENLADTLGRKEA